MNVLEELKRAKGTFVSGARLASSLGLTRAAIHKQIQRHRKMGYLISGTPHSGYRLAESPQVLNPAAFDGPFGSPFVHFDALPSTQEEAKRMALRGAKEGTIVSADVQTRGRGRLGRAWKSPKGGLWFSLILRPPLPPAQTLALPLVAALALAREIRSSTGLPACVKWPNDVWIGSRKVAGLLTEMSSETDRVQWMVIGVGVNVNNLPPRGTTVPAQSLKRALGRPVPRQGVLGPWLASFGKDYKQFLKEGFAPFRDAYQKEMLWFGRKGRCVAGSQRLKGKILGVDDAGRLLFLTDRGRRLALNEGEIRFTPLPSPVR